MLNIETIIGKSNDLDTARKTKIYMYELSKIHPSSENPYTVDKDEVDLLKNNILQNGLFTPLVAEIKDNIVYLISGHRRLSALQDLTQNNVPYTFCGVDITGKAPLLIVNSYQDQKEKILGMISANAQRDMSKDEKGKVIDQTVEAIEKLKAEGKGADYTGKTAHIVAQITGIKEHFVKDYLASKNKSVVVKEKDPVKAIKAIDKKMVAIIDLLGEAEFSYTKEDYESFKNNLKTILWFYGAISERVTANKHE